MEANPMADSPSSADLIGGRLSLDFANELNPSSDFSWEELLHFLLVTKIISSDRSAQLHGLLQNDPKTADALLGKAQRLHASLQQSFRALLGKEALSRDWIEPINEVLRVTEGHDELIQQNGNWALEFVAREGGL